MCHYIRLVAIGIGLLGGAGTASAWHPWHHHHHHHQRVVVVTTPATTTTTTTANVISQPVVVQPVTLQPVTVQPVYVTQPATTTTTANVISQPVVVQPVYVQAAQVEKPQAAQVEKVCPQQELRIRVFVEGGAKVEAVKVEAAKVDKEALKAMLALAQATDKQLAEAKKTNDALIKALEAASK